MKKIIIDENEMQSDGKFKYRYACPLCTNVAFYSYSKEPFREIVCQSCQKVIKQFDVRNYIKL